MSRETGVAAAGAESRVGIDVLVLALTGIAVGLLFNGLGRAGKPERGLDWLARPQVLVALDQLGANAQPPAARANAAGPADGATRSESPASSEPGRSPESTPEVHTPAPPAARAAATGSNATAPKSGKGAAPAPANDLPDIPELAQPIQVQLPVVRKFFDAKAALFVDAREPDEYAEGHIPGAINVTFDQSVTDPAAVEKIDSGGRPIIAYCGGGTCEVSMQVAWAFVQSGHKRVLVYMGGFPEWAGAGYPTAKGAAAPAGS